MITIKEVTKVFGHHRVLDGVNATIQKGEVVAILGSSGSGKSTLLRCINYLEVPTSGEIWVDGTPVNPDHLKTIRSKVGMVFQNFHLFGHMRVLENLTYAPMKIQNVPEAKAKEKAIGLLKQVGLESRAQQFPHTLSGGQKQRVAIARTLMMEPEVVLFDEPTSSLDPEMVQEVLKAIQGLAATGITILIVTHEMNFVKNVSTRVLFLDQGQIIEDRPTKDFFDSPHHPRITAFLTRI